MIITYISFSSSVNSFLSSSFLALKKKLKALAKTFPFLFSITFSSTFAFVDFNVFFLSGNKNLSSLFLFSKYFLIILTCDDSYYSPSFGCSYYSSSSDYSYYSSSSYSSYPSLKSKIKNLYCHKYKKFTN